MAYPRVDLAMIVTACVLLVDPAWAGPPFVTDDPEPVDYQHFEINSAIQGTGIKGARSGELPSMDINYGFLPDIQLHVGVSASFLSASGQGWHIGYGDTEFGVKYRFIEEDEEGWRPQIAFYPNIDFPTGNADKGLGSGHDKVFLPLWLQKSFADWQAYGGGGYWLNQHGDDRNYWFVGGALLRKFSEEWTLGGEVFRQSADLAHSPTTTGNGLSSRASSGFNLGGIYGLDDSRHILFSAGRGLQNVPATNLFSTYVGYQLTF